MIAELNEFFFIRFVAVIYVISMSRNIKVDRKETERHRIHAPNVASCETQSWETVDIARSLNS